MISTETMFFKIVGKRKGHAYYDNGTMNGQTYLPRSLLIGLQSYRR